MSLRKGALSIKRQGKFVMVVSKKRLVPLACLAAIAVASPSYAQSAGYRISRARAAAIHECSVRAQPYIEHTWGDFELYVYRTCMAEHGQKE
jgi:hypothetical protein